MIVFFSTGATSCLLSWLYIQQALHVPGHHLVCLHEQTVQGYTCIQRRPMVINSLAILKWTIETPPWQHCCGNAVRPDICSDANAMAILAGEQN